MNMALSLSISISIGRHAVGARGIAAPIDRVSKFTYVEFHEHTGKSEGAAFLRNEGHRRRMRKTYLAKLDMSPLSAAGMQLLQIIIVESMIEDLVPLVLGVAR